MVEMQNHTVNLNDRRCVYKWNDIGGRPVTTVANRMNGTVGVKQIESSYANTDFDLRSSQHDVLAFFGFVHLRTQHVVHRPSMGDERMARL